jgi:hypothetical protein
MNAFDWSRYAVGGAAARPDSFTGLDPNYSAAVAQLIAAAEQELGPRALTITSAYRSPEVQAQLWERALQRYGSPEAARKWVAPPGHSMHNRGLAVDFADSSGRMLRDANSREAQWIAQNAGRFGLDVPMSWEPWQVELAGARGRRSGQMPNAPSANGTTPQVGNAFAVASAQQRQEPEAPTLDWQNNFLDPAAFQMQQAPTRNYLAEMLRT